MAIILNTVTEALDFIDSFDGWGISSEDEQLQVEKLRNYNLFDDYIDEELEDE